MKYFFTSIVFLLTISAGAQLPQFGGCLVTFNIGNQTVVCSSQNVYLLPSGSPSGGTYSGSGVLDNLFFPSIAGPGEHIITYSYDDGFCSGSAQDTIVVVAPQEMIISGDFEICAGEATTITASNATDIEWSTNAMGESVLLAPGVTTIYSVSGYDENFCITSQDFVIEVNGLPDVVISGNTDVCLNQSTELIAFGAQDYVWDTGELTEAISVTPLSDIEVCVVGTDGNGCVSQDCAEITLHADPEITIIGDTDVCIGSSTILQATGGVFYDWNNGVTGNTITYQPLGGDEVCVVGEDQFGCVAETCVLITLLPVPQLILNGESAICSGDSADVVATGAVEYAWSNGQNTDSATIVVDETTTVQVTGTGENGCTALAEWTVIVFDSPVIEIEGSTALCPGQTTSLSASGAQSYEWEGSFEGDVYEVTLNENATVEVVGTDGNGCTATQTIDLTVYSTEEVVISGIQEICPDVPFTLTASGSEEYVWSNGVEGETAEFVLSQSEVISVVGTDGNGCEVEAEAAITILTGDNVDITGDLIVCPGDTIVATISGLQDPVWSNLTEGEVAYYVLETSGAISVTGVNSDGCEMTYSENATINPLPDLAIDGDLELCAGETAVLEASGAIQYLWSTGDVGEVIEFVPSTDIVITLEGVSNLGCTDMMTVVVSVNAYTPIDFVLTEDTWCDNGGNLDLSAFPEGGVFSGDGVSGSEYIPTIGTEEQVEITYTFTNESGCTSQAVQSLFVDNCSGVDESESMSFDLFPNPAEDCIKITTNAQGAYAVMIVNAHGQLVRSLALSSPMSAIDITDLSSGVYELVLMQNGRKVTKRFVKG